jgi:hypothetical protein
MMRKNGGHFPSWCNDRELLAMLIGGNEKPDADWLVGILENKWSFIAADIRAQIISVSKYEDDMGTLSWEGSGISLHGDQLRNTKKRRISSFLFRQCCPH